MWIDGSVSETEGGEIDRQSFPSPSLPLTLPPLVAQDGPGEWDGLTVSISQAFGTVTRSDLGVTRGLAVNMPFKRS